MFCTRCGTQVEEGNRFCQACGQEVGAAVAVPPWPNRAPPAPPVPSVPVAAAPVYAPVPAPLPYGGFWERVAAYLIDGLILGIPFWNRGDRLDFYVWRIWHVSMHPEIRWTRARLRHLSRPCF